MTINRCTTAFLNEIDNTKRNGSQYIIIIQEQKSLTNVRKMQRRMSFLVGAQDVVHGDENPLRSAGRSVLLNPPIKIGYVLIHNRGSCVL